MNLYVDPPRNIAFDPPFIDASRSTKKFTVIELGSGSGLVASSIARRLKAGRDNLIVTDLPEVGCQSGSHQSRY
jgi:predicted nicotinamide N-methyase